MCVIIINHQTFKFLIPQHPGAGIFISSEDALSLLLLFAAPPSLLSPLPSLLGVSPFPSLLTPRDKGIYSALGAPQAWPGSPNLLWGSGCDTLLPPLQSWGSLPNPFPVLLEGSNSTCFPHCLSLHFIHPFISPLQVFPTLQITPKVCLAPECCPQPPQAFHVPSPPKKCVLYP